MTRTITVVDYGLGNVGSVMNMLKRIGQRTVLAARPEDVAKAEVLVLPGVGHFDAGMKKLRESGLAEALDARVMRDKVPILGICLGMQLFTKGSEEGDLPGLGWLDAETRRFTFPAELRQQLPVPHMGWSDTTGHDPGLFPVVTDATEKPRFYYVHSFHVACKEPADVAATCMYGFEFTAAVRRGHLFGTQFHPEKSHHYGVRLLEAFVRATNGSS